MATIPGTTDNDIILGGPGNDNVIRSETQDQLSFTVDDAGNFFVAGGIDGIDQLIGIEQIVTADGTLTVHHRESGITSVNTTTAGEQNEPKVAALADGGYVVVWMSMNQDGDDWGIYAQRYDASGNRLGTETQINTHSTSSQENPKIAALPDGGYVVTWASLLQDDGNDWGVYAQRFDVSGHAVGSETQINTHTAYSQDIPIITALADGGYVVAWSSQHQDGSEWGVYTQRYDVNGIAVGTETRVNTTTEHSQIGTSITALADGGYVVTWMSQYQDGSEWGVYLQRFDASGTAVGTETQVNTTTANSQESPSVTVLTDGGYVVAWMSQYQDGSEWGVYLQRFDASGTAVGTETQVNTTEYEFQYFPTIAALADGGYVVVWESVPQDSGGWDVGIYSQRYDANGKPLGGETLVNSYTDGNQEWPSVAGLADGGYVITWSSEDYTGGTIYSQRYDADGKPLPVMTLSGGAENNFLRLDVQLDAKTAAEIEGNAGNDTLIGGLYDDLLNGGTGNDILVGGGGVDTAVRSETQADLTWGVAADGGISLSGITDGIDNLHDIDRVITADGSTIKVGETRPVVVDVHTFTQGEQTEPCVTALVDGGYVVVWMSQYQDGSEWGVYLQRFDASGNMVGTETQVNTTTANSQQSPSVTALADGGYVVAWMSQHQDSSEWGVCTQRFDATGATVGTETQVNTTTTDSQQNPSVTALADGGYVVAWMSLLQDGSEWGIYTQRFDASGNMVGAETQVNTTTVSSQQNPTITGLADGGYAVAWMSQHQDGNDGGIYTQRFDASGHAVGVETLVNTTTGGSQESPTITGLADGGYVVAWMSLNQDGDGWGIYTQRFDANGATMGSETQVNTHTYTDQHTPSIAALADGGYIVTWTSYDQGGDILGTYSQRYDTNGNAVGTETQVNGSVGVTQHHSSVTGLADGGYVITWKSENENGGSNGIYSQRYKADGNPQTVVSLTGDSSDNTLRFDPNNNIDQAWLNGAAGHDTLYGGAGQDILNGGKGSDFMTGGASDDLYIVDDPDDMVVETDANPSTGGVDTVVLLSGVDRFTLGANIEGAMIDSAGSVSLTGNDLDNALLVGDGDHTIDGGAGIDVISFILVTGDVFTGEGISINLSLSSAQATGDSGIYTLLNIENLAGSEYDDHLIGNSGDNMLDGDAGDDTLDGGEGADTLLGGIGNDTYVVDNAGDVVNEDGSLFLGGTDTVRVMGLSSYSLGNHIENAVILNNGASNLTGNSLDNRLVAGAGDNVIDGDLGIDTVSYENASAGVNINLNLTSAQATGSSGSDTLLSIEGIIGSAHNDTLQGNADDNIIDGGDGFDAVIRSETQNQLIFTLDSEGDFLVSGSAGGTDQLIGVEQIVTPDGTLIVRRSEGTQTRVNTSTNFNQSESKVAGLADGGYVVTWMSDHEWDWEIYTQRYDISGNKVGVETQVNTSIGFNQQSPSITALADGGYVVAWMSDHDWEWGIYTQRFDANGNAVGEETLVDVPNDDGLKYPSITALTDGGYVIAWMAEFQNQTGDGPGVYVLRYDSEGIPANTVIQTGTFVSASSDAPPSVTALANGGYAVTWMSPYQDRDGWYGTDIYVRQFNSDDIQNGTDLKVNTNPWQSHALPTITGLMDGGYVIVWTAHEQDGDEGGVFLQRFDADGSKVGAEEQVNTNTWDHQHEATVAALADGGYVVVWTSNNQDSEDLDGGIYSQRYDANGNPVGGETLVNSYTSGNQHQASVTGMTDGGYVITWSSENQDGSDSGIYNQRYGADGKPQAAITLIGGAEDNSLYVVVESDTQTGAEIEGGGGNDTLRGSEYDDLLDGGTGSDILVGSTGNDTYVVDAVGDVVTEAAYEGTDTVKSSISYTLGANLENLLLTGTAALNGTGNTADNLITGNSAANVLDGKSGADTLIGGDGSDTFYVDNVGDVITETNADRSTGGSDTVNTSIRAYTLTANVENGIINTSATANLTGNALNNWLNAGSGTGNNVFDGGGGADMVSYSRAASGVSVNLALSTAQATGGSGSDTLINIENLQGSVHADMLTGNAGANRLEGLAGNDTLDGGAGNDTMLGGDGADTYYVDNAGDMVTETNASATGGTDIVHTSLSAYTLGANVENGL
ncbi:MAG: hypothetical protein RLZZ352_2729, partial [Pseudomonadota bacterium]